MDCEISNCILNYSSDDCQTMLNEMKNGVLLFNYELRLIQLVRIALNR